MFTRRVSKIRFIFASTPILVCLLVASLEHFSALHANFPSHLQMIKQADSCYRFAFISGAQAGLGHMMSRVALGYVYSLEKRAELVIDKDQFYKGGPHGSYDWIEEVFDLSNLMDIGQIAHLKTVSETIWHTKSVSSCNIMYESCEKCCPVLKARDHSLRTGWCYLVKKSLFQLSRPFFQQIFRGVEGSDLHNLISIRRTGAVDVVWHVRVGDIFLKHTVSNDFVSNVVAQLQKLLSSRFHIIVLSEDKINDHETLEVFGNHNATFLYNLSSRRTFEHMVWSSVLVTSGSTFSSLATVVKPIRTLSLQAEPKSHQVGVYDVYEHAILSANGTIVHPDFHSLRSRVESIFEAIEDIYFLKEKPSLKI